VVEDVERLAALIVEGLGRAGLQAEAVHTAGAARDRICEGALDAVVLDLGLPDQDGADLLRELRDDGVTTPILILTTRLTITDRVTGLNAGADDYLTKPFAMEELVARLRALMRRPPISVSDVLRVANLSLNTQTREVEVDGGQALMTPKEQLLLEQLMRNAGSVVQKVYLEDNIYGGDREGAANSLEVLIHRLRTRLRELGAQVAIHTVRGVGYMLTAIEGSAR